MDFLLINIHILCSLAKKEKKNVDLVCIFMFYTSEMIVDFSVMPLKKKKVCVLQLDSGMMF